MKIKVSNANVPSWQSVVVKSQIPEQLKKLEEMSRNIWWAWNYEATELFKSLDPELWKQAERNPVVLLERLSYEKLQTLAGDKLIIKRINDVYAKFKAYMDVKPDKNRPSVAYFCMEYGLTSVLKIYSGGLGILAGDYMKEASDSNVDMCGIGFLYRYGYFTQSLSMDGQQVANYDPQIGADHIPKGTDEHHRPHQFAPPLRDGHAGSCCRSADVRVRSNDSVLKVELEDLGSSEAEDHVYEYHDSCEYQEERALCNNGVDVCRNTDYEEEQVDAVCTDLLRSVHFLYGLCHECSNEYGDGRDPYILGSEESYYEVHEYTIRLKSAEDACDELRDPYYCCSISDIDGDVLERDILAAPELSGKCLCLFKVYRTGLDLIDQRMLEVLAEPAVPCEEDKYKEVDSH